MKFSKWYIAPAEEADIRRLGEAGYPQLVSQVLAARGISTAEEAAAFLERGRDLTCSPFLMKDMDRAVECISRAISQGRRIAVFGDYDVDGITATVILVDYLKSRGVDVLHYIPRRIEDGYGLGQDAIRSLHEQGVELLITVDCGITGVEEVDFAASLGMDVVITDHHECKDTLPRAVAVVDPHRPDCTYPFPYLAGCGVALKLVLALGGESREEALFSRYCTLAAIGTIADVMPMSGENRIIVSRGLECITQSDFIGLHALLQEAGLMDKAITSVQVGFVLAPRINAAGRMRMDENDENASPSGGHAAVELLIEGNESIAEEFGSVIDAYNQDRKSIDRSVTQEAHDYIEGNPEMKALKSTVIYNPRWMKGIVGIVASRLIETYYRPTVVLTMSNGFVTGSARSVPGFDLYQAIESCSDLLENFGGHMYAAGLTMRPERVEEFTRRFNAYVEENIDPITLQPQVEIDSELFFSNITPAFRRDLNRFQPFGPGNPAPVFVTRGVVSHGETKLVGADCEHLRMDLMQRQKPNTTIQTIAFQQPTHYEWIRAGHPIDVCYQIVENHYRGSVSVQLRIKDIKTPAEQAIIRPATSVKTGAFRLRFFTVSRPTTPAAAFRPNHSFPLPKRKNTDTTKSGFSF